MRLYIDNNNDDDALEHLAGLRDISRWFDENYPADIFIKHPITAIRDALHELVNKDVMQ
jgi:hypothetical protein